MMKVLISGGGTGGHVFPAIAVADALRAKVSEVEVLFVGALGKLEMTEVPKSGYNVIGLDIRGFNRKKIFVNLKVLWKLGKSLTKSVGILKKFRPDIVVGVGGYASGPVMLAAKWLGIPIVIQEQNSYPGLTNRRMAKYASMVCAAFDDVRPYFKSSQLYVTGNPVRKSFSMVVDKQEAYQYFGLDPTKKTICVFGGSLGAATMNKVIIQAYPLIRANENIQLIWQVGKMYENEIRSKLDGFENQIKIFSFIDRMDFAYAVADVAICRAGALTISEIAVTGTVSILVPSPNVTDDHQTKNAMSLVQRNASVLVKDEDALRKLWDATIALLYDDARQAEIRSNLEKLAKPQAADEIAQKIITFIQTQ
ncbi:MAG: undecaprenyldiphospho-muramoylpentapeptide beta-N-acetylglucosaminyltransferase [Saprospiraceae bacterium]|nr:undecaprenyldiphospho-muramoylpentapeptide beta-N-acetylglucosaminyltransferase [Saprospiraceae bacterium]